MKSYWIWPALVEGEKHAELFTDATLSQFLSFWSDWDGSNRPSGQGHRLIAAVVMENVRSVRRILNLLRQADPNADVDPELISELNSLPQRNQRFTQILNTITLLTHQLEQRYRGTLPFSVEATPLQSLAARLHLRRDPVQILLQHNDRYERRMLELRQERRAMLEYYLALNKKLRKQLHTLIPAIQTNLVSEPAVPRSGGLPRYFATYGDHTAHPSRHDYRRATPLQLIQPYLTCTRSMPSPKNMATRAWRWQCRSAFHQNRRH